MALRLLIENEKQLPDGGPTSYTLNVKGAVEIGRADYLDWVLPDTNKVISNKHCEIRWNEDAYWLTDNSRNGTFLNGSEDRMVGTVRLKNGDRIAIGHYIIAVTIDEPAGAQPGRPVGMPKARQLDNLWSSDEEAAPPIDRRDLLPPRPKDPRNDPFNRVAELPRFDPPPPPPVAPAYPAPAPIGSRSSDDDWLPRRNPVAPPAPPAWEPPATDMIEAPPPPAPAPIEAPPDRRAETPVVRAESRVSYVVNESRTPGPWMEDPPSRPVAPPPPRPSAAPIEGDAFVARFAKGLGIPEAALAGRDPGAFAEDLGRLVQMIASHLKALLDDRQQAKRVIRVADHTMIAAFENNPLKFTPTVQHALAVMFGPPNENYQDARTALEEAFKDLAEHQLFTLSAMQKAVQLLEKEIAPEAIEASVQNEKSLAVMVGWAHGRLWDAYVHRWADRTKYHGDGLSGAFMRDFARCYDDLQKAKR